MGCLGPQPACTHRRLLNPKSSFLLLLLIPEEAIPSFTSGPLPVQVPLLGIYSTTLPHSHHMINFFLASASELTLSGTSFLVPKSKVADICLGSHSPFCLCLAALLTLLCNGQGEVLFTCLFPHYSVFSIRAETVCASSLGPP